MNRTKFFIKIAVLTLSVFTVAAANAQTPKQEQLLNGLKVLLWPDAKAEKVTVRLRIHAGSAFDPQGKEGTMQLLADNLFPNAAAREFFSEDLGGSLDIISTYDYIQVNASSTPDQVLTMLETLSSAVANPSIDKETTTRLKNALSDKLRGLESDPAYAAERAVSARLLGTFPYGRPQLGSASSVHNIGFADLIDARQRFLTADNSTFSISGNFDRGLTFKAVRRYFGSWLKSDRRVPTSFRQPDQPAAGMLFLASPQPGVAVIRAAFRSTGRGAKDFAVSEVYARILEDRLKARVPAEHSASVMVRNESHVQPGILTIGFAASKNDIDNGRGSGNGKIEANTLITKALSDPISDAEFSAARSATVSRWQKSTIEEFWLDADTYRIASADAYRGSADRVTLAEVRDFAVRLQQQPMAIVLVAAPVK